MAATEVVQAAASAVMKRGPRGPGLRPGGPILGRKQIFLPNFTLTLLRTPSLPPTFASFLVPLSLNKLDLRDYLWNCYNVEALSVRSYIQQQKIRQGKPGEKRAKPRQHFRPRAIKKMTVEMEKPFVWAEVPDLEKWDKTTFDAAKKDREQMEKSFMPDARQMVTKERGSIREQALRLRKGEDVWKQQTPSEEDEWEDVGEEVEVEQDVKVPRVRELRHAVPIGRK